jgi:hypothetical protein
MSRTTTRAAALTGLTATTVATGLLLAPAALAESLPVASHSEVTAGQVFTLSGQDCLATKDGEPAIVYVSAISGDDSGVLGIMDVPDSGDWTIELKFPGEALPGDYELFAGCEGYEGAETDAFVYYPVPVTLKAAPTPSTPTTPTETAAPTTAAPETKPTGALRGTQANTPGVASPDKGSATGDSAAPGRKVVKVLTGFKPGEVVTVTLHSTPQTIGTFTADQNGTVTVSFTVPAGTPTGDHTLVYEGSMGTYFQESFSVTTTAATSNASSSSLAYTGADVALPLGLGVGALALGGGLVFAARRRSAEGSQA